MEDDWKEKSSLSLIYEKTEQEKSGAAANPGNTYESTWRIIIFNLLICIMLSSWVFHVICVCTYLQFSYIKNVEADRQI